MAVKLETKYAKSFIRSDEILALQPQVTLAHEMLHAGTGLGNDFLGWVDLPVNYDKEEFARIQAAAARIKEDTDVFYRHRHRRLLSGRPCRNRVPEVQQLQC